MYPVIVQLLAFPFAGSLFGGIVGYCRADKTGRDSLSLEATAYTVIGASLGFVSASIIQAIMYSL